ncbi:MAG: hypothetical protein KF832_13750 [Caldilineaceae bacterium]|nr:hypothetical protein [Caldilineaceae bacterium]
MGKCKKCHQGPAGPVGPEGPQGPAGIPASVVVTATGGELTVDVGGVVGTLDFSAYAVEDLSGNPIGYLMPL